MNRSLHVFATSRGALAVELGDIDILADGGRLHLFHLILPSHDAVGHMTSQDGLTWTVEANVLHTGPPGSCDDDMIWTMHTVQDPVTGQYRMYYTACSYAETGQFQRVALAKSDSLDAAFERTSDKALLEPAPPHYNNDLGLHGFVSFRDPFVFIDREGGWHMLVTAREADGPRFRRGCVAHATSDNGDRWTLQPPLYAPHCYEDVEVPALLELEGRFYLFFHDFSGQTYYRIADSLDGPWLAPSRDELLPTSNSSWRFARWGDDLLLFHWLRAPLDFHRRSATGGICMVPAPKRVEVLADGTLTLRPYVTAWRKYFDGPAVTSNPKIIAGENDGWRVKDKWLSTHAVGCHHAVLPERATHFILTAQLRLDEGNIAGIMFRSDEDLEAINVLRLDYATQRIELHKHVVRDSGYHRYKLAKTLVQEMHVPNLTHGRTISLRLLACREYIEVSLDDEVYLSAATFAVKGSGVAVFVEDGKGSFADLTIQKLVDPPRA